MATLLDNFEKQTFTDPVVQDLVHTLCSMQSKFENNKGAQVLAGTLIGIGRVFPAEADAITGLFRAGGNNTLAKPERKNWRKQKIVKTNNNKPGKNPLDPCPTCPGGVDYVGTGGYERAVDNKTGAPLDSSAEEDFAQELDEEDVVMKSLAAVKSWREVANVFKTDVDAMEAFCSPLGINTKKATSPGDYSKLIYNYLRDESIIE